jgi:putative zinc finger/helix-turn-helix YgiT family protein
MTPVEPSPKKPSRCPVCGQADLQLRIRTERFEEESDCGKVVVVAENVPVEVCKACGEVFSGPEAWRIRDEARCRAFGLLTPQEIRVLRERLGLTQQAFARLIGIGADTLAEWEGGRLIQDRAMDCYLRLLDTHPENLQFLA